MAAIPPNTNLEGFKKSMIDGIDGAFKKGVKYGRYLAQQEQLGQKKAAQSEWISVEKKLPGISDLVLVIANGRPRKNITLQNALLLASYWGDDEWFADGLVGWGKFSVTHWMSLPEPPKEEA